MPELNRCGCKLPTAIPSIAESLLSVGGCSNPMSRYPIFYCAPAAVDAGFKPVEAADAYEAEQIVQREHPGACLLYTSPSPRDLSTSRMPSSA